MVRSLFPAAELMPWALELRSAPDPFSVAAFFHDGASDPSVTSLVLVFRNDEIRQEFIQVFGGYPYESTVLGEMLQWKDIEGYAVDLSKDFLNVELADPSEKLSDEP